MNPITLPIRSESPDDEDHPATGAAAAGAAGRPVLIFEPNHDGHRLNYVRRIVEGLTGARDPGSTSGSPCCPGGRRRVIVALGTAAPRSAEYETHLRPVRGQFELDDSLEPLPPGTLASAWAKLRMIRRLVRRHRPGDVLIPYADGGLTQVMGVASRLGASPFPAGTRVGAISMRGGYAYPARGWRRRLFNRVTLKTQDWAPWSTLYLIDPLPYRYLREAGRPASARARLLPDPVDAGSPLGTAQARRRLGLPEDGRYLGTCGVLDCRKGVDLLIRAFLIASGGGASERAVPGATLGENDRLLLVGRCDEPIRALLDGEARAAVASGRIVVRDRYVPNEELGESLRAMDVVCVPYPGHIGSASIVIRAAAAGRPVLGTGGGWIGDAVRRHRLGWTCDVTDAAAFAAGIAEALHAAPLWVPGEGARAFVRWNTNESFSDRIAADFPAAA